MIRYVLPEAPLTSITQRQTQSDRRASLLLPEYHCSVLQGAIGDCRGAAVITDAVAGVRCKHLKNEQDDGFITIYL
jgi:hypothetical protein